MMSSGPYAVCVKVLVAGVAFLFGATGVPQKQPAGTTASSPVELSFAGYTTSASVVVGAPASGQVQIEAAYLSVQELRFRPADACDQAGHAAVVPGPILAELVGRRATGLEGPLSLPRARYCGVDLRLRRADGSSGVASLPGQTILIRGRRDDGVPFLIRTGRRDSLQLVARDPKGFAIADGRQRLFLAVDLGRWMEGIDLAALVPGRGKNGMIRIDEHSHRDVLRRFEQNLRAGLALCGDLDDDGVLSPRECAPDRRLAAPR